MRWFHRQGSVASPSRIFKYPHRAIIAASLHQGRLSGSQSGPRGPPSRSPIQARCCPPSPATPHSHLPQPSRRCVHNGRRPHHIPPCTRRGETARAGVDRRDAHPVRAGRGLPAAGVRLELRLDGVTSREDQVPGFAVG